ncbi:MAG: hypothetical protein ACLPHP_13270 [Candidatus Sulfotelmatobacter sp.]
MELQCHELAATDSLRCRKTVLDPGYYKGSHRFHLFSRPFLARRSEGTSLSLPPGNPDLGFILFGNAKKSCRGRPFSSGSCPIMKDWSGHNNAVHKSKADDRDAELLVVDGRTQTIVGFDFQSTISNQQSEILSAAR